MTTDSISISETAFFLFPAFQNHPRFQNFLMYILLFWCHFISIKTRLSSNIQQWQQLDSLAMAFNLSQDISHHPITIIHWKLSLRRRCLKGIIAVMSFRLREERQLYWSSMNRLLCQINF